MPNPYPVDLRERAVREYDMSAGPCREVAGRFDIGVKTLVRWVQRAPEVGDVTPLNRGGGWSSPVAVSILHRLMAERPDRTTDESTRAYNAATEALAQVHLSGILRALRRSGYVFKENGRCRSNRIVRASKPSGAPSSGGSFA